MMGIVLIKLKPFDDSNHRKNWAKKKEVI